MSRLIAVLALVGAMFVTVTTSANAAAPRNNDLAALWTKVLEKPSPANPFGSGGAQFTCVLLPHIVAPFGPTPVPECQANQADKILVVASSWECSTFEGNGTTEPQLRTCARENDVQSPPIVTLDGQSATVSEVETPLMPITLPGNNIFGQPAGTGLSVAHGWVALLGPLSPGTHTVHVGNLPSPDYETKIVVRG